MSPGPDPAAQTAIVREYRAHLQRRNYAPGTIAARLATARRWVDRPGWRTATFVDVERWIGDHDVTAHSQRNLLGYLRSFYRWAMRAGLVEHDPTALAESPRLPRRLPRPARDADIAHVLAGAGVELAAIVGLMAGVGLRCIEVSRLTWDDVDLAAGTVRVFGKGSRERVVHPAGDVLGLVAAIDGHAGPVFPGMGGGHRTAARISQMVNRAFRAAGYATVAHQLRHRAATTALAVPGVKLLAVRDMLGHSSVSTTEGYTAVTPGSAAAASRAVRLPL